MAVTNPSIYYGLPTGGGTWNENAIYPDHNLNAALLRTLIRNSNYQLGMQAKKCQTKAWPDPDAEGSYFTYYNPRQEYDPPTYYGSTLISLGGSFTLPTTTFPIEVSANAKMLRVRAYGKLTGSSDKVVYVSTRSKPFISPASHEYSVTIASTTAAWSSAEDIPINETEYGQDEWVAFHVLPLGVDGAAITTEAINMTDAYDSAQTSPGDGKIEAIAGNRTHNLRFWDSDASLTKTTLEGALFCFLNYDGDIIAVIGHIIDYEASMAGETRVDILSTLPLAEREAMLSSLPYDEIYYWAAYDSYGMTISGLHYRELEASETGGEVS